MKLTKYIVLFIMFSTVLVYHPSSAQEMPLQTQTIARAAIDFGSGALKIQVSLVDPENNCMIGEPLLAKYVALDLTEDVAAHDGRISEAKQQQSMVALEGLKAEALSVVAQNGNLPLQFTGIATAVFRKAENGLELLQRLEQLSGIRFQILTQEEEGILGYMAAKAIFSEFPADDLVVWDSGNGSFQMSAKQDGLYNVYQGPLGHGTARLFLAKEIRNGPPLQSYESVNPVSHTEAAMLTEHICARLPPIPNWLQEKLADEKRVITAFGDAESIFAVVFKALAIARGDHSSSKRAIIEFVDIQTVLAAYLDMTDEELDHLGVHRKTLTSAILLSAVMRHFGIQAIHYQRAIGNTAGMLISPYLWGHHLRTHLTQRERNLG